MVSLAEVRRMEAVSFRSMPADSTFYDGTWAIRLSEHYPAKRVNSVNPLDPQDIIGIDERIEAARHRFACLQRQLIFRLSPLAPPELEKVLVHKGWERKEESLVMLLNLSDEELARDINHIPSKDIGQWVDHFLDLSDEEPGLRDGLSELIRNTQPECGLFLKTSDQSCVGAVRCVCDNDMAGIFDLVTAPQYRGKGHAHELLVSSLNWAKISGARFAWLQVVAHNEAAVNLYRRMGFKELYRYAYYLSSSHEFCP